MKLVVTIMLAMIITQFAYYHELDQRQAKNKLLDDLRWSAQLDAFSLHAKSINELTDLLTGAINE